MKRYLLLLAISCMALCINSTPVTIYPGLTLEENNGTYYIHFKMPKYYEVIDTFTVTHPTPLPTNQFGHNIGDYLFSRIQPVEDDYFDYLSVDGRPELPFYSLNLLMPSNGGHFYVSYANIISTETIGLPYDYTPSQAENYTFEDFSYDGSYYGAYNNTWYWNDYAADTLWYRHTKGFTFSIFPCHYEPSHRELTIVDEAEFEISYNGSPLTNQDLAHFLIDDRSVYYFYDNFVGYPAPYPQINDEYLIITTETWKNTQALADFIQHKESLGYHVTLASTYDIGYTPDEIRKYIKKEYEIHNVKFVLLVGNVGVADSLAFSAGDPPTDLFYSCLSKNNINDQWKDYSPSVFVGRWPIQTPAQLREIVDKTIVSDLYMGQALTSHGSSKIALFSGEDSNIYLRNYWYNDCKYVYKNIVQKYSYYTGCIHDGRSATMNLDTMKHCLETIDSPTWMFVYNGHGWNDWIAHPYDWTNTNIAYISTRKLEFQPFGFGFTCLTGNIYWNNNFARSWLTDKEGGITYLGATTTSYNVCDRYFSRKMFNQLKDRPDMTIGEFISNAKAKYYNPDKVVWRRREAKKYVLYGDPSLYLFGINLHYNQPYPTSQRSQSPDGIDDIKSNCVYSITGQLLRTCDGDMPNLQGLPTGTYMVVYSTEDNQIVQKIVIQ